MSKERLFKSETKLNRTKIAAYLRSVADSLDEGRSITLKSGDQSVTLEPPEFLTFEVEAEREGRQGEPGEINIEFELEWDEAAAEGGGDGPLEIE